MSDSISSLISASSSSRSNQSTDGTETQKITNQTKQNTRAKLQIFRKESLTQDEYNNARKRYLDGCKALHEARESLIKFQTPKNPKYPLPRHLQLDITTRLTKANKLPDSSVCKVELEELIKLEKETDATVYDILLRSKQKSIDHLSKEIQPNIFITREVQTFTKYVSQYANAHDEMNNINTTNTITHPPAAASPTLPLSNLETTHQPSILNPFPRKEAIEEFEASLHEIINNHMNTMIVKKIKDANEEKSYAKFDMDAQKQILDGAHNGETMKALVQREAQKIIAPIQSNVSSIINKNKRKSKPNIDRIDLTRDNDRPPPSYKLQWLIDNPQCVLPSSTSSEPPSKRTKADNTPSISPFHRGGEPHNTRQLKINPNHNRPHHNKSKSNHHRQPTNRTASHQTVDENMIDQQ